MMIKTAGSFAMLGSILAMTGLSAGGAVTLAPHRAVYDMASDRVDPKSGLISVKGLLVYELRGGKCNGWSTTYRIANRYLRAEGVEQLTDTQLTSWESGDGTELNLSEKNFSDRQMTDETSLEAKKGDNGEATVHVALPDLKNIDIPKEALFPMTYQERLLQAAAGGRQREVDVIYEGTEADKAQSVVALIGRPRDGSKTELPMTAATGELQKLSAWPMSLSYYDVGENAADVPHYQSSFLIFANGVSTNLLFDYGTYSMRGTLKKLEMLPAESCP